MSRLQQLGKRVVFLTNNATRPDDQYLVRFKDSSINTTMVSGTRRWLKILPNALITGRCTASWICHCCPFEAHSIWRTHLLYGINQFETDDCRSWLYEYNRRGWFLLLSSTAILTHLFIDIWPNQRKLCRSLASMCREASRSNGHLRLGLQYDHVAFDASRLSLENESELFIFGRCYRFKVSVRGAFVG